jgi:hypothetical protein
VIVKNVFLLAASAPATAPRSSWARSKSRWKLEAVDSRTRITVVHGPGRAGQDVFDGTARVFAAAWEQMVAAARAQLRG